MSELKRFTSLQEYTVLKSYKHVRGFGFRNISTYNDVKFV